MSGYDITQLLTVPGRLVLGPSQGGLVAAYPYQGTPVGYVARLALEEEEEGFEVFSEVKAKRVAWGAGVTKAALVFVMLQYDPTLLNLLYAFTTTSGGGFAGANTLRQPDLGRTLQPGLRAAGAPLLFAADDPAHPSAIVHAPYYSRGGKRRFDLRKDNPLEQALVVLAGEDANGHDISIDLIEHLSLT